MLKKVFLSLIALQLILLYQSNYIQAAFAGERPCSKESGLLGKYFSDPNFTDLFTTQVDRKIEFNWSNPIMPEYSLYHKSFEWTGKIKIERPGIYRFQISLTSAQWEGETLVFLYIDGRQVLSVAYPSCCSDKESKGESEDIRFPETGLHDIKISATTGRLPANSRIGNQDRITKISLQWRTPDERGFKVVPSTALQSCSYQMDYLLDELNGIINDNYSKINQEALRKLEEFRRHLEVYRLTH